MQVNKHCVLLPYGAEWLLFWAAFNLEPYEAHSMLVLRNYKEHGVRVFPCDTSEEGIQLAEVLQ